MFTAVRSSGLNVCRCVKIWKRAGTHCTSVACHDWVFQIVQYRGCRSYRWCVIIVPYCTYGSNMSTESKEKLILVNWRCAGVFISIQMHNAQTGVHELCFNGKHSRLQRALCSTIYLLLEYTVVALINKRQKCQNGTWLCSWHPRNTDIKQPRTPHVWKRHQNNSTRDILGMCCMQA